MSATDLTPQEQQALAYLAEEPAVSPSMLADEIGVRRQNAYRLLQRLVDADEAKKKARGLYTST